MQWTDANLDYVRSTLGVTVRQDALSCQAINHDFGGLVQGGAHAVIEPHSVCTLQSVLQYANHACLPLTIRANGLSQSGQSLAIEGGISLDIHALNSRVYWEGDTLLAGCSASWKSIIATSLERNQLPCVYPYNTNLTLGGVLSVGGIGASSFKEGIIAGHVDAMQVVTANGERINCSNKQYQDLFNACLSGLGSFGVIYEAALSLRPCQSMVRAWTLYYDNPVEWLDDQFFLTAHVDYLEAFVVLKEGIKQYVMTIAIEYEKKCPSPTYIHALHAERMATPEDMPLTAYIIRHDPRIKGMQESSAWHKAHPWYECYVDANRLLTQLETIIDILGTAFGGLYHVFPIASKKPPFFMRPEGDRVVTFNILSPSIEACSLTEALKTLTGIDETLQALGGKRYVSGWFNHPDWEAHYGAAFQKWLEIKTQYDPMGIFCSRISSKMLFSGLF